VSGMGVSIPFIAGQWSLRGRAIRLHFSPAWFQSPSLRGSGRFVLRGRPPATFCRGFNPLHCGAVVASRAHDCPRADARIVSIPFIAGQWSLRADYVITAEANWPVSIPFIAGQWSLRHVRLSHAAREVLFQSPSLRGSGRFQREAAARKEAEQRVSIPFIAGQWSLPEADRIRQDLGKAFQSPSLRGSGRFRRRSWKLSWRLIGFQSPSLRGSGRFARDPLYWSLNWFLFQSPSLRGSGRFRRCSRRRRSSA